MARVGVALAVALGCLGAAAPVEAGWRIDRARAIANIVWKAPCGAEGPAIQWRSNAKFAAVQVAASQLAAEHVPNGAGGLGGERAELAFPGTCVLWLNRDMDWEFEDVCAWVLHATGHLAGFRDLSNADPLHSSDPDSIMHPGNGADWRCGLDNGRRFLERHGRLRAGSSRLVGIQ